MIQNDVMNELYDAFEESLPCWEHMVDLATRMSLPLPEFDENDTVTIQD